MFRTGQKVKGRINLMDNWGKEIGKKDSEGTVLDILPKQGRNGDILKVKTPKGKYEFWQIGHDEIEVVECEIEECCGGGCKSEKIARYNEVLKIANQSQKK